MSEADAQDKSYEPTPSRLERARRDGDVAYSRELTGAAAYLGFYVAVAAGAAAAAPRIAAALAALHERPESYAPPAGGDGLGFATLAAVLPAAVFLAGPAAGAVASLVLQQNVVLAAKRIAPKLKSLSPLANARRKFGPDGLMDFARSAAVLFFIFASLALVFAGRFEDLPGTAYLEGRAVGALILAEISLVAGALAAFTLAVGIADLIWVRARRRKRLMMSFEELRRDSRETDGDPHFKQARRERARAFATNRMLSDVPKASVVVVNPEHYAVALKWDGPKAGAPVLVAKGVDRMADKIRELAMLNGVPIRRDPPAARAIYAVVEIGQEIRREHFAAVAAAIHFAEAVRKRAGRS